MTQVVYLVLFLAMAGVVGGVPVPCPHRCLCFGTTVRCMFLQLERIPEVPEETTTLDLRFNKIRDVTNAAFKDLKYLNTLLLNNNHLSRIDNGAFTGLHELRYLYLYKNRIKTLGGRAFHGLDKLEQLYIHFNRIEDIAPETFSNLPALERLFLHNNKLSHIPGGAFRNLDSLRRLRLDSNALVCDCKMMWLARLLKDKSTTTQAAATCEFPTTLQGKSLAAVTESDFKCKKPSFTEEPHDVEVSFGGTRMVYFTCKADGDPDPDITWLYNHNEIPLDDEGRDQRYNVLQDGTLMIENPQDSDEGVYECMAKNAVGEVKSRTAKMQTHNSRERAFVDNKSSHHRSSHHNRPQTHNRNGKSNGHSDRGKPRFLELPQSQEVVEGDTVTLKCEVSGIPQPIITWTLNGELITSADNMEVSEDGTLTITEIDSEESGTYTCSAVNYLGRITTVAQVKVQFPPEFRETPSDRSVASSRSVEFNCEADGFPFPHITWFKDGRAIVPDTRVLIGGIGGSNLQITSARKSDEGVYQCRAQNIAGVADTKAHLEVIEKVPPSFRLKPPRDAEAKLGGHVELPCVADGIPIPLIVWRKDGSLLVEGDQHQFKPDGSLLVNNISKRNEGEYECTADNGIGIISTFAHVRVKGESFSHPGDRFVRVSLEEARHSVDKALNDTLRHLLSKDRVLSPADLLRLFRFPGPSAREAARAAEIYERTLLIIKRHVEAGAMFNLSEFSYTELLSPTQLQEIANMSGCLTHRQGPNCSDMCFHTKYRTYDGTCNNLQHPMWGASETGFYRLLRPKYENGFNTPISWTRLAQQVGGFYKPSARLISTRVISTDEISQDTDYSHMLMQWGQFLDHDLDLAPPTISSESFIDGEDCASSCERSAPCFPIEIPPDDPRITSRRCMEFSRSAPVCGSGSTSVFFKTVAPREQINVLTSYMDASQVYGSSETEALHLRVVGTPENPIDKGLLRGGEAMEPFGRQLLPFNDVWPVDCRRDPRESNVGCFLAGDVRVNEQLGLTAMHVVWFREHNRVAIQLGILNPNWDGEKLYQEARKIVGAEMQHITYAHWLPKVFGTRGMLMLGPYAGYDPGVDASISNSFATAAMRFGHTLINPVLQRLNSSFQAIPQGHVALSKAFFSPFRIMEEGGVDPLLRGLFSAPAKYRKSDQLLNKELTEQLFRQVHAVALDLAAINIQRGRDHAIPTYNDWRKHCNLTYADTFDDLQHEIRSPELRDQLRNLYGHPSNIDLWVGGVSEDQVEGARVGPTFLCILVDQFKRLRDGDRFWYENAGVFRPEQLTQIHQASLGRIICDNADNVLDITHDVFTVPQKQSPPLVSCNYVPRVDLRFWTDCNDCEHDDLHRVTHRAARRVRRDLASSSRDGSPPTYNNSMVAGEIPALLHLRSGPRQEHRKRGERLFAARLVTSAPPSNWSPDVEELMEERVEGMEDVIRHMQKQLRQLSKKVKQLEADCHANRNV